MEEHHIPQAVQIRNAHVHNLKNIDVDIPLHQIVGIAGVSGSGKSNLVEPMMIAAVAAGADGLEVEVHYDPAHAWSDGAQCLTPDAFAQAMAKCRQVAWAIGREM